MRIGKVCIAETQRWARFITPSTAVLLPVTFDLSDWRQFRQFEGPIIEVESMGIQPPVPPTAKLICIGKNYVDHATELGGTAPELPIVFSKFATALNPPFADVLLPALSKQVDFEAELVVVIGKPGKEIHESEAMNHVLGYMCGNDVSARDWQKGRPGGQWLVGKSFDTFAPVGPWITTLDELPDPEKLEITLWLNDEVMQRANTHSMIFSVSQLVSYLSRFFTLNVGDLIFTGTPAGVGAGRNPPVYLQPGDQIRISIDGLGEIVHSFRADSEA